MFDLRIQIVGAEAIELDENTIEIGVAPILAIPGPGGQAMPLQLGIVRMPIPKEMGHEFLTTLKAALGEEAPKKKSDIVVATSMAGVEQAANMDKKIKGK